MRRSCLTIFRGKVVSTAVYLLRECPTTGVKDKTHFEAFSGRKPRVKHLKIFGCVCYSHIHEQLRHKLDKASIKRIFVGYGKGKKNIVECYS